MRPLPCARSCSQPGLELFTKYAFPKGLWQAALVLLEGLSYAQACHCLKAGGPIVVHAFQGVCGYWLYHKPAQASVRVAREDGDNQTLLDRTPYLSSKLPEASFSKQCETPCTFMTVELSLAAHAAVVVAHTQGDLTKTTYESSATDISCPYSASVTLVTVECDLLHFRPLVAAQDLAGHCEIVPVVPTADRAAGLPSLWADLVHRFPGVCVIIITILSPR